MNPIESFHDFGKFVIPSPNVFHVIIHTPQDWAPIPIDSIQTPGSREVFN